MLTSLQGDKGKKVGNVFKEGASGHQNCCFCSSMYCHLAFFIGRFFRYDDAFLDILAALAHLKFESKEGVDGQGVGGARGPNDGWQVQCCLKQEKCDIIHCSITQANTRAPQRMLNATLCHTRKYFILPLFLFCTISFLTRL